MLRWYNINNFNLDLTGLVFLVGVNGNSCITTSPLNTPEGLDAPLHNKNTNNAKYDAC